jgi:gamma-glutamylcyclotransferase (GGCT)/AIG2-like uncharacterized protein YtfP
MLYFGYGSKMNWRQIEERCPSARFGSAALLPDYNLAFTRKSVSVGCGVADAVPERGRKLWGVVYEISDLDIEKLDASEGYSPGREKNAYRRRECPVLQDRDDAEYKQLIGSRARHWHLPKAYVCDLEGSR